MSDGPTGSTVPRRQLGRYLRNLRSDARLTVKAAARALEWSEAKMWRIESGQSSLRALDVQAMCAAYGAPDDLTQALMGLAKETKARGWWHAYGDVTPEGFHLFIGLEEAASEVDWYETDLMPGLLQTRAYAQTIIQRGNPDEDEDEVARRVNLRMSRQVLLTRPTTPANLNVVLSETVLRRPVCRPLAMAEQLRHLLDVDQLPNVNVRVIPFAAGFHLGVLSGPFGILRFPPNRDGNESEPPTVYADGFTGDLYLDKPDEVARYNAAFADICTNASDEQTSRRLISEVAGSYDKQ